MKHFSFVLALGLFGPVLLAEQNQLIPLPTAWEIKDWGRNIIAHGDSTDSVVTIPDSAAFVVLWYPDSTDYVLLGFDQKSDLGYSRFLRDTHDFTKSWEGTSNASHWMKVYARGTFVKRGGKYFQVKSGVVVGEWTKDGRVLILQTAKGFSGKIRLKWW